MAVGLDRHLVLAGPGSSVTLPTRLLLAPMQGVSDPPLRAALAAHGGLGGAMTDYARISAHPHGPGALRRRLGPALPTVPTALQILTADTAHLGPTLAAAAAAGADWIDLNCGCPSPKVTGGGGGAALLGDPARLEAIVRCALDAGLLPVSVKLRPPRDRGRYREILAMLAAAGVAAVTVHARHPDQGYGSAAQWEAIAVAVDLIGDRLPVIGNGSVWRRDDAERMVEQTGCTGVMIARGALADPWLCARACGLSAPAGRAALRWLIAFIEARRAQSTAQAVFGRLKQFLRYFDACGALAGPERSQLMAQRDYGATLAAVAALARAAPAQGTM
ncbi:MAG: tRNA-dihydrouridine synthase [Planctomycetota bacterium]